MELGGTGVSENKILPCIACGKENEPVGFNETEFCNQPYGATSFNSWGHYGSTVFDPMGSGVFLEINICDGCMVRLADEGKIYLVENGQVKREPNKYSIWNPREDDYS